MFPRLTVLIFLLVIIISLYSQQNVDSVRQAARQNMEQSGIPFTEQKFIQAVTAGDSAIVRVMLEAGIRPFAKNDEGETALVIAVKKRYKGIADMLVNHGASVQELIDAKSSDGKQGKDFWDIFGTISSFLSAILIALFGFYATNIYKSRSQQSEDQRKGFELKTLQVQTIEKFFAHLSSGDESKKKAAILAIAALGDKDLAVSIGQVFEGSGASAALVQMVPEANQKIADRIEATFLNKLSNLKACLVIVKTSKSYSTGFFIESSGLVLCAAHGLISDDSLEDLRVIYNKDEEVKAVVVKSSEKYDLALLQAAVTAPVIPLEITPATELIPGTEVIGLSNSMKNGWSVVSGTLDAFGATIKIEGINDIPEKILVKINSMPGSSGAPVFDTTGKLVGIIQATSMNNRKHMMTVLIAAKSIAEFLAAEQPRQS